MTSAPIGAAGALPRRTPVWASAVAVALTVTAGCGDADSTAGSMSSSTDALITQVWQVAGVADVAVDGERLMVTLDQENRAAWETVSHGNGPERPGVVELAGPSGLDVWLRAASERAAAEVRPDTGGDLLLVRQAQALFWTPGVASVRLDGAGGEPDEVTVATAEDLQPVARVAWVHRVPVEDVRLADGNATASVAEAAVPQAVSREPGAAADGQAPSCAAADLDVALVGADAALGHRMHLLGATNVSSEPCAVAGYPELSWYSLAGQRLDVRAERGDSFMSTDAGPQRIVLTPGARATAAVGWDAASTAGRNDMAARVDISAFPGAQPVRAPLSGTLGMENGLSVTSVDVLDGSVVEVAAWELSVPEGSD